MSVYRLKLRNNYSTFTGGTISPMINPATGTQSFDEYLTIYKVKPGQYQDYRSRSNYINNLNNDLLFGFSFVKDKMINSPETFFNRNNLPSNVLISSGTTIFQQNNYKTINIPIETKFNVVDYSEDLNNFVEDEKQRLINPIIDGERVKYVSEFYPSITLKFRFYDKDNDVFDTPNLDGGYGLAGFLPEEINIKNNFKKSFFRLYFYESNDIRNQNLLLSEDIDLFNNYIPEFSLDRIFWLKNDQIFMNSLTGNRRVYMEARFFNAKTGRVHRFINLPLSVNTPITISNLATQPSWKHADLLILNPNNNNGKYLFRVVNGIGASTTNSITMTEYILTTQ
jgi:hypothetical protein